MFRFEVVTCCTNHSCLLFVEGYIPEADLSCLDGFLLSVVISKEEGTCAKLPMLLAGRSTLSNLFPVDIDSTKIVLDHKQNTVPLACGQRAIVAESGIVQTDLSILDEEAAVLCIG